MRLKYLYLIVLLSVFPDFAKAQGIKDIRYVGSADDLKILERYDLPVKVQDSLTAKQLLTSAIYTLQKDGFLLASLDSVIHAPAHWKVYIQIGEKFKWARLNPGNIDEGILSAVGFREKFYQDEPLHYADVARILKKIIRYSEINGFPFASVKLDSIIVDKTAVQASLNYDSGPLITFDTLKLSENTKTKPLFLASYLRLKPGSPYDEKKVEQATSRLRRLPYLSVDSPPYVTFQLKKGTPYFDLRDVKSNQVDGIIGLLPNEGANGKSLITGQFNLLLNNILGTGKMVNLRWQRPEVNSQNLDVKYVHPNLFRSPLNVQGQFFLLKEDTLFINRNLSIEASLLVGRNGSVKMYSNFKVARIISEAAATQAGRLSDLADFNLNQYGLGYDWNNVDNLLLPTKGFSINVQSAVGNKSIRKNGDLSESYYDSIQLETVQYDFEGAISHYYPLRKRIVLKSQLSAGAIIGEQLFANDMFRLGGLSTLRGFQENSFFASGYAIGSIEPQFLLDNESYFFLFYDQAYLQRKTNRTVEDYPAGLGAGLTFSTQAGIFTFVYALGKAEAQPFSINYSKIHFGYITRF